MWSEQSLKTERAKETRKLCAADEVDERSRREGGEGREVNMTHMYNTCTCTCTCTRTCMYRLKSIIPLLRLAV